MKIVKPGKLRNDDEPYLSGTCGMCDCEVQISYNEWRWSTKGSYVKCPTPRCVCEISLHQIDIPTKH